MPPPRLLRTAVTASLLLLPLDATTPAQTPTRYLPTAASLDARPLPQWYADAKLGIFIVWGLYSVPAWAPLVHKNHDFASNGFIVNNPYAEWYYNVSRIPGSPTEAYNREHYGAAHNYYDFAAEFNKRASHWDADKMAAIVAQTPVTITPPAAGGTTSTISSYTFPAQSITLFVVPQ